MSFVCIFSLSQFHKAHSGEKSTYSLNPSISDIRILVFREGLLKTFGHNHVIRVRKLMGTIVQNQLDPYRSRFDITIPVSGFEVDNPDDRKREGGEFSREIERESIRSTRKNLMSEKVLNERKFPFIKIMGTTEKMKSGIMASMLICIKSICKNYVTSLETRISDKIITAKGEFSILQTDHDITPLSLLGGVLRVKNEIKIKFDLEAQHNY